MSLKGSLESFSLGEIFQSLSINQHTGTLVVEDGEVRKLIYFTNGHIIHLSTGKRDEFRLGDMLVWSRSISPEQLDEAKVDRDTTGRRLGEILVDKGWASEEDISQMVVKNIEEEIYDLFLWKKADFEFKVGYFPEEFLDADQKASRVQLSTNSLIMEALRRIDEWSVIRDRISTFKAVFAPSNGGVPPEGMDDIELPDIVKSEVELVDGHRNVAEIVSSSPASKFEVCKLLYELLLRNLIRPLQVSELVALAEDEFSTGQFSEARKYLEFAVEQDPNNPDLRLQLADAYSHTAADKAAVDHLLTAARLHQEQEEHEMTVVAYRKALELQPHNPEIMENLFNALVRADKLVQAQNLGLELGELLRESLQFSKAVGIYLKLSEKDPKETSVRMLLAGAYKGKGDLERALVEYHRVADQLETEMRFTELEKVYRILKALATKDEDLIRIRRKYERIEQRKESRERRRKILTYGIVFGAILIVLGVVWEFYASHEYQKVPWPKVYDLSVRKGMTDEAIFRYVEEDPDDVSRYGEYVDKYEEWVGEQGDCEKSIDYLDEFRKKFIISYKGFQARQAVTTIRDLRDKFTRRMDLVARKHAAQRQADLEEVAAAKLVVAEDLLEKGEFEEAFKIFWEIWAGMDLTEVRKNMSLFVLVSSDPGGAQVYVDGKLVGATARTGRRPVRFAPEPSAKTFQVRGERKGYFPASSAELVLDQLQMVDLVLKRKTRSTMKVDGAVHGVPLEHDGELVFCSRGGTLVDDTAAMLYRFVVGIRGEHPAQSDLPVVLGQAGDRITPPLVHYGSLIVGTSEGKLVRIRPDAPQKDLATVKSDETDVKIPITAGPAALPGGKEIYYGTYDGRLFHLDPTVPQPEPREIFRAENKVTSVQCLPDPGGEEASPWVILGSLDETVRVIRGSTGQVVWEFSANGDGVAAPVVTEEYICVGTTLGSFFILDRATGKVVNSRYDYGPIWSLAGTKEVAYLGSVAGGETGWGVTALTIPDCEERWETNWPTPGLVTSGIRIHEDAILFGDQSGRLTVLAAGTGEFLWDFQAESAITALPLCVGDKVFVGSDKVLVGDARGNITVLGMTLEDASGEEGTE